MRKDKYRIERKPLTRISPLEQAVGSYEATFLETAHSLLKIITKRKMFKQKWTDISVFDDDGDDGVYYDRHTHTHVDRIFHVFFDDDIMS